MKLKNFIPYVLCLTFAVIQFSLARANELQWYDGSRPVALSKASKASPVLDTAIGMFMADMECVTGQRAELKAPGDAVIVIYQLDNLSKKRREALKRKSVPVERLDSMHDGFDIRVIDNKITITGRNGRGAAYGLLELSRMAGVSPWIWWGDVIPRRRETLAIDRNFTSTQGASVEFRGIFLNDEDWSLRPWSCATFEPGDFGSIGPETNREIFKLLMRLRANAVWPAMHPGTRAFFANPANKLMADSCGIAVGTSHCEPLLRNNVGEWDESKRGPYNYITNRHAVQDYWIERLKEVRNSSGGNMFTIGMRGVHDGSMEGVKTKEEKLNALQQVIDDQQMLLDEYIGNAAGQVQVFVPYKEVLDLYESGLEVPDHVTLMWCDDNYGYMTRLSDEDEQTRGGGGGVYYHLSYWGRPHDYLWLATTQPGLIYNEMLNAYNHGVRKLWIANVHDPKVAAYDMELFLDLAWNIDCVSSDDVGGHLERWLSANFGQEVSEALYPALRQFYRLCAIRRPEFMGWNQVELSKNTFNRGLGPVSDTEFSFSEFGSEADWYMDSYSEILRKVEDTEEIVPDRLKDAYFAAIKYPVAAAANNAVKMLEAQRARSIASGSAREDFAVSDPKICKSVARSQKAYQNIRELTAFYNDSMAGGKWKRSMNMHPRDLPVAAAPVLPVLLTDSEVDRWLDAGLREETPSFHYPDGYIARNADSFDMSSGPHHVVDMLGHGTRSVELAKGSSVSYAFNVGDTMATPTLTIAAIPTQPNDKGNLRYKVSVDGADPMIFDLKEPFRSEQWKLNVLRAQALRKMELPPLAPGRHTLEIEALDPHIVIDQWCVDGKPGRKHYVIPVCASERFSR